jgi:hypothetical protein
MTFIHRQLRINLDLRNLRKLNNRMQLAYENWVDASPASYKADGFFSKRQLICITSRYGQNIQLELDPDHQVEEIDNWKKERDFANIRYFTVAVASHLQLSGQYLYNDPTHVDKHSSTSQSQEC